jgi:integrase
MPRYPEPFERPGRPCLYFAYTDRSGKRHVRSTGERTKGRARTAIERFMDALRADATGLTFAEYAEPFFLWERCPRVTRLRAEGKQIGETHTRKSRAWLERALQDGAFAGRRLAEIRRADVLQLRDRLMREIGATNTLNKIIDTVKTVLSEAYYQGHIDRNPGTQIGHVSYTREGRDVLTVDEIRALCWRETWPTELAHGVYTMAAYTGMRSAEILGAQWQDLDGDLLAVRDPKWRVERTIALPATVLSVISERQDATVRLHPTDRLWCWDTGRRLGETWWRKRWYRALERIGLAQELPRASRTAAPQWIIPDGRSLTPHSLRHSLNTHLRRVGVDALLLDHYLWGHSQTMARVPAGYTHIEGADLREIARAIETLYG